MARRTLECCGLAGAFDVVVCADEVSRAKPDPEPVRRALDGLRVDGRPDDVLFVGDSPHDLRAGRAAGTRTAAATWGPFPMAALEAEVPDFYLEGLDGVLATSPVDPGVG